MYGYMKKYPENVPYWNCEGSPMGGAKWVRMPQSEYARAKRYERREVEEAFFVLPFHIEAVPEKAEINISAINLYRLYVNGVFCAWGPRKGDVYSCYYDTVDIAPWLKQGQNIIGVYVVSASSKALQVGKRRVLSATPVYHGLECIGLIVDGKAGGAELSTGKAEWRTRLDESMDHHYWEPSDLLGSYEDADLRLVPEGWMTNADVSSKWAQSEVLFTPGINYYGQIRALPLHPRPFSRPVEEALPFTRIIPPNNIPSISFDERGTAVVPPHTKQAVILDAGENTTCFVTTHVEGANATVRFTYSECFLKRSAPDGRKPAFLISDSEGVLYKLRRDDETGIIVGAYDEIITARNADYEPFRFRPFRFIRIDVETRENSCKISLPSLQRTRYPLQVETAVSSSSQNAMWLWETSLRTVRNCIHDSFESDTYYEQLQYVQDAKLMMDFVYAISPETALQATTLWDFHSSLRPDGMISCSYPSNETQVIPGFSLEFIWMVERYYLNTGDKDMVCFYRPTIDAILAYFERHINDDGLCEGLGYWEFGDWSDQWNGCHGRPDAIQYGASSLFNLMYAYTLQLAARLNRATNRPGMAEEYEARAKSILEAVRKFCWNKDRGMICEGPGFGQYSQYVQALGVLTGLLEGEEGHLSLIHATKDPDVIACSLPVSWYLLRALEKYDMQEEMRQRLEQFAHLREENLTTMPEWSLDGPRSDCHPWSCLALYEFPATVLGVRPLGDGWQQISIAPKSLGYDDFSGNVYTPRGNVHVAFTMNNGKMVLEIETPWQTVVTMPEGRKYRVTPGKYTFRQDIE